MSSGADQVFDEIRHPKEEGEHRIQNPNLSRPFLTYRQLSCLVVMFGFLASGMVSMEDFAFVVFSVFYVIFLSKFAFPSISSSLEPPVFGEKNRLLGLYVLFAAFVGLFFPIVYILEGVYEGNKEGIKAAVPHFFLLASQVFMEGVTFSHRFSLPIRAFVPISYNTKRIFTIVDWLRSEMAKVGEEMGSAKRLHIGRELAVANLILWSYNLFGFLLPVYLPRVFKRYYGYKVKA